MVLVVGSNEGPHSFKLSWTIFCNVMWIGQIKNSKIMMPLNCAMSSVEFLNPPRLPHLVPVFTFPISTSVSVSCIYNGILPQFLVIPCVHAP